MVVGRAIFRVIGALAVLAAFALLRYDAIRADELCRRFQKSVDKTGREILLASVRPRIFIGEPTVFYTNVSFDSIDDYGPDLRRLASAGCLAIALARKGGKTQPEDLKTMTEFAQSNPALWIIAGSAGALPIEIIAKFRGLSALRVVYIASPSGDNPGGYGIRDIFAVQEVHITMYDIAPEPRIPIKVKRGRISNGGNGLSRTEVIQAIAAAVVRRPAEAGDGPRVDEEARSIGAIWGAGALAMVGVWFAAPASVGLLACIAWSAIKSAGALPASLACGALAVVAMSGDLGAMQLARLRAAKDVWWLQENFGLRYTRGTGLDGFMRIAHAGRLRFGLDLSDDIFRRHVLCPWKGSLNEATIAIRNDMWRTLMARVARHADRQRAVVSVAGYLRGQCWVIERGARERSLSELWSSKAGTQSELNILYVECLRAIGVPARVGADGSPEVLMRHEWQIDLGVRMAQVSWTAGENIVWLM
jgi:hypothetical protein